MAIKHLVSDHSEYELRQTNVPIQTMPHVSFKHILRSLASFIAIPNSVRVGFDFEQLTNNT
jgi:hypothetical protein